MAARRVSRTELQVVAGGLILHIQEIVNEKLLLQSSLLLQLDSVEHCMEWLAKRRLIINEYEHTQCLSSACLHTGDHT